MPTAPVIKMIPIGFHFNNGSFDISGQLIYLFKWNIDTKFLIIHQILHEIVYYAGRKVLIIGLNSKSSYLATRTK